VAKYGSRRMAGLVAENVASQTAQGFELSVAENIGCYILVFRYIFKFSNKNYPCRCLCFGFLQIT